MKAVRHLLGLAFLFLLPGCDDDLEIDDAEVGVGMSLTIDINDSCPLCSGTFVEVLKVIDKIPGVFEIEVISDDSFRLTALRPGSTKISVAARKGNDDVEIARADFGAHLVDSVRFDPFDCPRYQPPDAPVVVVAGIGATFETDVRSRDDVSLQGELPLDGPEEVAYRPGRVTLIPESLGIIDVTTPVVDATLAVLDVRPESDVDGLVFSQVLPRPVPAGYETTIEIRPTVGGDFLCLERYPRTLTITTPETCEWSATSSSELITTDRRLDVRAMATGTCSIEAILEPLALGGSLSFEVTR